MKSNSFGAKIIERTCTLRHVARAARIREQSAGWVKRNPTDDDDEDDDEDETEHQKGDCD
jgi:hypothetical protein